MNEGDDGTADSSNTAASTTEQCSEQRRTRVTDDEAEKQGPRRQRRLESRAGERKSATADGLSLTSDSGGAFNWTATSKAAPAMIERHP